MTRRDPNFVDVHVGSRMRMRRQLIGAVDEGLLVDGTIGVIVPDAAEAVAWGDWSGTRLAPKALIGEGFPASAAWHCVVACDALQRGVTTAATVSAPAWVAM